MLIGLGVGCAVGVYFVQSESEGHGRQGVNKLKACGYFGGLGAVTAVLIVR